MLDIDAPQAEGMDEAAAMEEVAQAEAAERAMEALRQKVRGIAGRLDRLATAAVGKKQLVEDRWYHDLRQYHGRYDNTTEAALRAENKSRVFANLTRAKTNAWIARLCDLLFPTDDKNWGIRPTPVPELADEASRASAESQRLLAEANAMAAQGAEGHEQVAGAAQDAIDRAAAIKANMDEARRRAERMEAEMDDQLVESRYSIHCRDAISNGCILGTGITKGPVVVSRTRRKWVDMGGGAYVLQEVGDPRPGYTSVDPWRLYPDPNATGAEDAEYWFERHLMNEKDLRALAKKPMFDADAIRRVIEHGAKEAMPSYVQQLRTITDGDGLGTDLRFHVWEYHGPLTAEDLRDLFIVSGDLNGAAEYAEIDPLTDIHAVVWFCQGEVLQFGIHALDSGDPIYSVWQFARDEMGLWGRGVPNIMRDSQAALNAAWRMMLDNGKLSTGPQIVIDRDKVEPADGKWTLEPRKVWWAKGVGVTGQQGMRSAFDMFHIDGRQGELLNIVTTAKQFMDEETSLPIIAQGEQGANVTQTANGMAMLQNAANVIFRQAVKNWDDQITIPNITRLYEWNMLFNRNPDIKGDFEVDARGSSVLLVRELQAQNLLLVANSFAGHAVFGPWLKESALFRKVIQAHMIAADEVVKTDEEMKQQQASQQPPPPDPAIELERQKLEVQVQLAQMDADARLQAAQIARETEMAKLAAAQGIKVEELRARLGMEQAKLQHDERVMAAEIGFKAQQAVRERQTGADLPDGTRFAP